MRTTMTIGYLRVATDHQAITRFRDLLLGEAFCLLGIDTIYVKVSGAGLYREAGTDALLKLESFVRVIRID